MFDISGFSDLIFKGIIALFYSIMFLLPGFLLYTMQNTLSPRHEESQYLFLLKFLTYSCLNYVPYISIIYIIFVLQKGQFILSHPILSIYILIFIIFINPLIIGGSSFFIYRWTCKFNCSSIHSTAWDFVFKQKQSAWILVTLKDDSKIAGKYAKGSQVSLSSKDNRNKGSDIYIKEIYELNKKNKWVCPNRISSMWISGEEIKYIEFWQ